MIEPKEIEIRGKRFILTKLPATAGREIFLRYPQIFGEGVKNYAESEDLMMKLMKYVYVKPNGVEIPLSTKALIDNHVSDGMMLVELEKEMLNYSFGFFEAGVQSDSQAEETTTP